MATAAEIASKIFSRGPKAEGERTEDPHGAGLPEGETTVLSSVGLVILTLFSICLVFFIIWYVFHGRRKLADIAKERATQQRNPYEKSRLNRDRLAEQEKERIKAARRDHRTGDAVMY